MLEGKGNLKVVYTINDNILVSQQSQKHYMVGGSLCLTSFIKVELLFSLVVIGHRPGWG